MIEQSATKIGNQWMIPYPWKKDPNLLPDYIAHHAVIRPEKKVPQCGLYSIRRQCFKEAD